MRSVIRTFWRRGWRFDGVVETSGDTSVVRIRLARPVLQLAFTRPAKLRGVDQ